MRNIRNNRCAPLYAYIVAIGDELLTGKTLDYNSHWIAKRLTGLGVQVLRITVIPDDIASISEVIKDAVNRNIDIIITTGGLGPTPGDVTLEAIAKALNRKLILHEDALRMIKDRYEQLFKLGFVSSPEISPEREKMAKIPEGGMPFFNPIGVAPGVLIQYAENKYVIALPGVPSEMMYLLEQVLSCILRTRKDVFVKTREKLIEIRDESAIARILEEVMSEIPQVHIKSYPLGFGERVYMRVIGISKADDPEKAEKLLEKAFELLEKKLHERSDNL